jgi:glycosyltransferase involved in cell wall biosynthesis
VLTNTVPHYRVDFFRALCRRRPGVVVLHSTTVTSDGLVESADLPFPNEHVPRWSVGRAYLQSALHCLRARDFGVIVAGLELKNLTGFLLWVGSRLTGQRFVWWTHGYNVHETGRGLKFAIDRAVKTFLLKRADRVLLYTDHNKGELVRRGVAEGKITVLNNALNEGPFRAALSAVTEADRRRVALETRASAHTVAFVGRLTREKEPLAFVEVCADLARRLPDLRALVIGAGDQRDAMGRKAQDLGLDEHVFFLGTINDPVLLAPYLAETDLFVLPGAVGLTVVQGMICGIPTATLAGAAHSPEVAYLRDDETGYLASDLTDLARWAREMLSDEARKAAMNRHCLETVDREVNLGAMVDSFVAGLPGAPAR